MNVAQATIKVLYILTESWSICQNNIIKSCRGTFTALVKQEGLLTRFTKSKISHIISVQIKGTIPRINKKFVEYRSLKSFNQEFFLNDLEQKNLNSIVDKCDNVNSAYEKKYHIHFSVVLLYVQRSCHS
jgi:uncharacterized membrane protein